MIKKRPSSRYFLLELIVNSVFFILAAAVCLNLFAYGYSESEDSRTLSGASMVAQEAAEVIKATKGDTQATADILGGTATQDGVSVSYDADWMPGGDIYTMSIDMQVDARNILSAHISITGEDAEIFALDVTRFVEEDKEVSSE